MGTSNVLPWWIFEPHRARIERYHGQTLERLAERGGLDPRELDMHKIPDWREALEQPHD